MHDIKYYIDKSNSDTTYTRNRYRKNILPLLKQETPNVHKQFLKYSKTLLEYNNYLEEELLTMYPKIINNNTLDIKELLKQHTFLQKNLLYKFLNNHYQNQSNIVKEQHIEDIINIINSPKPNSVVHLPQNKTARKSYDYLYLEETTTTPSQYKILLQDKNTIGNITIEKIDNSKTNGNDICRLNSKKISLPLYLRTRKDGDYIEQKGLNGKKKIKEIFIENKIPQNLRNSYPILVDSNDQIIWIPNLKKSKFNSSKDEFYDIILKYCEKEENDEQ